MMYTIYIPNGQITKVVGCDNVQDQLSENEAYIEGNYPDDKYYIVDGFAVLMPSKPSEYCVFNYKTKQWVDPRTPETQWPIVRAERNRKLQACDWTQLSDIPLETKMLWETYRQELRDITNQPDPFNVIWPTKPE
ncbi:MAG: hypothetical protein EAZ74_04830 [Alphaproteobacteria bacterium]|nr:MAG: hypothetical protein EAZ74_04830 [Alphaproteobacteria bacterium]